ncbi:MAG: diversity-generating retroelement protein Avd [Candidatus Cloacimonetes bacterium]|nr:diversity-generating retroelement protein Avd [Candidatus Cloacimonadota bacterium]
MDNIPILNKVYDILKWIIPRIEKFPRTQKFVLGDRLENSLLDLQQMLLVALKADNKERILELADAKLAEIKMLARLATDLQYLSLGQNRYLMGELIECGKMLGGWRKKSMNH